MADPWLSFRELDERSGVSKGTSFRAFKALEPELQEGRDFRVLRADTDEAAIETLREQQRIYASSITVVLVAPAVAARLRIASGDG